MILPSARRSSIVMSIAAWVCGCSAGPDFIRPQAGAGDSYTAVPPASSISDAAVSVQQIVMGEPDAEDWWKPFHSAALDSLMRRAVAHNLTLEAAAATLDRTREVAAAQAGRESPQLAMTASVGGQKYGAEFLGSLERPPPFKYFAIGPTVSYTLDYTGGVKRSVEQARAMAEYERHELDAAFLVVTGNVVLQAFEMASLRAQIDTLEEVLAKDRSNLQLVTLAFEGGSVSRVDVLSAQSQLAADATLLPPLQQQLDLARHALAILLGESPARAELPEFKLSDFSLPPMLRVRLPSELAHHRPDILAAEAQLHAANAAVGVAEADLYPHIDLTGQTGLQSTEFTHLFEGGSSVWGWAANLTAPLLDGGTLRAQRRAAIDALRASAANYQQTVLTAFGQIADALDAIARDAEELDAQLHAQDAAQANEELIVKSYAQGNVGVLPVLDAERRYQQAKLGYTRAQKQRYSDTAQLLLALGGSSPAMAHPTLP